jgi:4-amino-4-deoxy-L-arabinose transferase-like glycosyltransferase
MNKANDRSLTIYYAGIFIISALLFIPFIGQVHLFDWDEINFAESAREMIASHDYLTVKINFIPFWEKPPLFRPFPECPVRNYNAFDSFPDGY